MPGGAVLVPWPIYFVRHGETAWNAQKRFQGLTDIPLNRRGRKQASRNGSVLGKELTDADDHMCFYASPLVRARETMEIIRARMSLPEQRYMLDERLIEIDLGDWNGKTPAEINKENPGIFERRQKSKWDFVVPGGESYANAAKRTREFLETLEGPSVIVGHGASGRLLRGYLRDLDREKIAHLPAPQNVVIKLFRGKETLL